MWTAAASILFAFTSILLIFIVLLQRGRGGGLAGAFGAAGGQSAFGTKAGDVFTRITIGVALVWVCLAAATGYAMRSERVGLLKLPPTAGEGTEGAIDNGSGQALDKDGLEKPGEGNAKGSPTQTTKAGGSTTAPAKSGPGAGASPAKAGGPGGSASQPTAPPSGPAKPAAAPGAAPSK